MSELLDSRLNKFWDAIQTKLMRPELGKAQSDQETGKREMDTSLEERMDTLRFNQEGKRKKKEATTGMESENTWSKIVGRKEKERERWKKHIFTRR